MGHLTYGESKKIANKTIIILGVITIVEVLIALVGKGHIGGGAHWNPFLLGSIMIILSAVKAYLIVYEFMHMKYEVPGLVKSVLLPTFLLVWAIIAFSWEGKDWFKRRDLIKNKNNESAEGTKVIGQLIADNETKFLG